MRFDTAAAAAAIHDGVQVEEVKYSMLVGARALAWSLRALRRMPGWNLRGGVEAMSPDMVSRTRKNKTWCVLIISAYVTLLQDQN